MCASKKIIASESVLLGFCFWSFQMGDKGKSTTPGRKKEKKKKKKGKIRNWKVISSNPKSVMVREYVMQLETT